MKTADDWICLLQTMTADVYKKTLTTLATHWTHAVQYGK